MTQLRIKITGERFAFEQAIMHYFAFNWSKRILVELTLATDIRGFVLGDGNSIMYGKS